MKTSTQSRWLALYVLAILFLASTPGSHSFKMQFPDSDLNEKRTAYENHETAHNEQRKKKAKQQKKKPAVLIPINKALLLPSYAHDDSKATALLVMSFMRSGSGSFVDLITKNLSYVINHEMLNPGKQGDPQMQALQRIDAQILGRHPGRSCSFWHRVHSLNSEWGATTSMGVFGFKVFPEHVNKIGQLERLLQCDEYNTKVIVLERMNDTAHRISIERALGTGNWGQTPEGQKSGEIFSVVKKATEEQQQAVYERKMKLKKAWYRKINHLQAAPSLHVAFEDFIKTPEQVLKSVDNFVRNNDGIARLKGLMNKAEQAVDG